ncbi:hypothetical protein KIN20_022856 [Parelaphostrongylus tenuis]|uniref:Uncharacterized protein n=1 Tax=Parelaphostrongylus tenuis TaxID=148309 RepID=A0AAD5QSK5_PARTN|nr:hypothetical protein KIN20_022856 [Parelaphostrongylus tenuis]
MMEAPGIVVACSRACDFQNERYGDFSTLVLAINTLTRLLGKETDFLARLISLLTVREEPSGDHTPSKKLDVKLLSTGWSLNWIINCIPVEQGYLRPNSEMLHTIIILRSN